MVGGGVSASHERFLPLLKLQTPIVPAMLLNQAGIVGAAAVVAARYPLAEAEGAARGVQRSGAVGHPQVADETPCGWFGAAPGARSLRPGVSPGRRARPNLRWRWSYQP